MPDLKFRSHSTQLPCKVLDTHFLFNPRDNLVRGLFSTLPKETSPMNGGSGWGADLSGPLLLLLDSCAFLLSSLNTWAQLQPEAFPGLGGWAPVLLQVLP